MEHAGQAKVINELRTPCQEAGILASFDRSPEEPRTGDTGRFANR
jgi:hypothetical protein